MGLRFFRRMKILPGMYINLGKRGASLSFGPRGAKINVGRTGVRSSVGIPGTGVRYEKKLFGFSPHDKGRTVKPDISRTSNSLPEQNFTQHFSGVNHKDETASPIPPDIDVVLSTCHEALVQNTILNLSLIILGGALIPVTSSVISSHLPATSLYGFAFLLIIAFAFRVVLRLSS